MSHKLPCSLLLILAAVLATTSADAVVLPDSLIMRVFPFKVGQQYQFKAGGDFRRPTGWPTLPANTVIEITITDTLINGNTWLHIPFWSPFALEYYRLVPAPPGMIGDGPCVETSDGKGHSGYAVLFGPNSVPYEAPGAARGVAYLSPAYANEYWDKVQGRPWISEGWWTFKGRLVNVVEAERFDPGYTIVATMMGAYGDGSALHCAIEFCLPCSPDTTYIRIRAQWGLFRPKSDDPWPVFSKPKASYPPYTALEDHRPQPTAASIDAYPNPFNATIAMRYGVPVAGPVTLRIYTVTGQFVRTLVDRRGVPGTYTVTWDGRDVSGRTMASGVYVVRLHTASDERVLRVSLVR